MWTDRHLVFQAVVGGDLPHRFLASFLGSRRQEGLLEFVSTPPTATACLMWLPAQTRAQ